MLKFKSLENYSVADSDIVGSFHQKKSLTTLESEKRETKPKKDYHVQKKFTV